MKRFAVGVLCAIAGYVLIAFLSYFCVLEFSSNTHDRSVEAAMTSVFFYGPVGAIVAFIVGFVRGGRRPDQSESISKAP